MRIGIYVGQLASRRGYERNVSGHVQVPLHAAGLLRDAGHVVELITTQFRTGDVYPDFLPKGMAVHQVVDGIVRKITGTAAEFAAGAEAVAPGDNKGTISPSRVLRQALEIRAIVRDREIDVLHLFGHKRTADLAVLLTLMRLNTPIIVTLFSMSNPGSITLDRPLGWKRIDCLIVPSSAIADDLRARRLSARIIRHGVIRDLRSEARVCPPFEKRHRVLFWRDASHENGADLCRDSFDALAPRYPDLSFDFAIRPFYREVPGLDDLAERHQNIHVHRFPYQEGLSLPKLVSESLFVVLPFRSTSMTPQLAIAETLTAGIPVVTTDVDSNRELLVPGVDGLLVVPDSVAAIVSTVSGLLDDRVSLARMASMAADVFRVRWNWDGYVHDLEQVYQERANMRRAVGRRRRSEA